jgi:hypothetical protein
MSFVAAKQDIQLPGVVPTLLIGLGGTGTDVVMRLRKMLFDQGMTAKRPYLRYLLIDTDEERWCPRHAAERDYLEVRPQPDEFVRCAVGEHEFRHVFDLLEQARDERFAGWLKPTLRQYGPRVLYCGAGTHRQFGRVAFMLRYPEIRHRIDSYLRDMLYELACLPPGTLQGTWVHPGAVEVVIVTSLAGGTGAGMFIDIAYLVRDIVQLHPALSQLTIKTTTLVAVMPSAFARLVAHDAMYRRLQQNGYACLLEMEHYGSPRSDEEAFLGTADARPRVGFVAPWKQNQFIEGVAWDVCHLIDGANIDQPHMPLDIVETCQMIADYLFRDFAPAQFSTVKQSRRCCTLVQYRHDQLATWVRNPALTADADGPHGQNTDVVFAARNSCGFSSFGQSEISFPWDQVHRAAGCLLASRLVLERWLGPAAERAEAEYIHCVRRDLFEDKGEPSFRPEGLLRDLYRDAVRNWCAEAQRDSESLWQAAPYWEGVWRLRALCHKHEQLLQQSPPGPAYHALVENAHRLGDLSRGLPPLHQRLHDATRRWADQLGVAAARRLLPYYSQAIREMSRWFAAQNTGDDGPMHRLEEAEAVPWPARKIALQIEFPRACRATTERILGRYRAAAGPVVDELMGRIRDFIGLDDGRQPGATLPCESLRQYFERAAGLLEAIGMRLRQRFEELSQDQGTDRHQLLPPLHWTEEVYRAKIDQCLAACPDIGPAPEGNGFDWDRFQEWFFDRLRQDPSHEFERGVNRLTALLDRWFERRQYGHEAAAAHAEELAGVCYCLLASRGLDLRDYCDGAVLDILQERRPPPERDDRLEKLVGTGAPYLPLDYQAGAGYGAYQPHFTNLLGLKAGDVSGASAAHYQATVQQIEAHGYAAGGDAVPLTTADGDRSSLVLCREVWGVPLGYHGRLDELHAAYQERRGEVDELHINYRECADELPDIRPLSPAECEQISAHADTVVWAIMVGAIGRDQHLGYFVRVPDSIGAFRVRLGMRVSRAVRKACVDQGICQHLASERERWEREAGPQHGAFAFAAALWTYECTRDNGPIDRHPSPLRNLSAAILRHCERHLAETEEGRWRRDFFTCADRPEEERAAARTALFNELIHQGVLFRTSDAVPLWTVEWSKQDRVRLPPS